MSQRSEFFEDREVAVLPSYMRTRRPLPTTSNPLSQLVHKLGPACETAVDSQQIAAALEAHGYNDQMVLERYGYPNVFELAEALFRLVPRKLVPARRRAFSVSETLRELSHGFFYGMPGLFYPPVVAWAGAQEATLALILSVILGWSWSQGMIRLAYVLIGRGFASEALLLLRTMMFLGLGLAVLIPLITLVSPPVLTLVVLQMAYHMAAGILLLYKRELWLMIATSPAVLAGLLFLVAPNLLGAAVTTVVMGISALVSFGAALITTRAKATHSPWKVLQRPDWLDTLPLTLYGLLSAIFVLLNPFWHWITETPMVSGLAVVPLVLSMGGLEWQLRVFLERMSQLLGSTNDLGVFARNVNRIFFSALFSYGLLLLVLSLIAVPMLKLHDLQPQIFLMANFLLGLGFFVAFTLTSMNRSLRVLLGMALALTVYVAAIGVSLQGLLPLGGHFSYLLGCGVFFIYMTLVALPVLRELRNYQ